MSLELDPECKKRLVEKIAEVLPNVHVNNLSFLDSESAASLIEADSVLPQRGPLTDNLLRYIGEIPMAIFLQGQLAKELEEGQDFDKDTARISLTEIDGYRDPFIVAKRLIEEFVSLPWTYTITIKLEREFSEIFAKHIHEFILSEDMRLVSSYEMLESEFPLHSGIKARDQFITGLLGTLLNPSLPVWQKNSAYLQIKTRGYMGKFVRSITQDDIIFYTKALFGIGIAIRMFKVEWTYKNIPLNIGAYVHKNSNTKWIIEQVFNFDSNMADSFSDLILNDLDGSLDSEEKKVSWIKKNLELLRLVFNNKDKSKKIILAGQWLFDSCSGRNELLSFIQMIVVLEILLGEKASSDLMGLGELLRNRCAYLIGKGHNQRRELLNNFKTIYDLRSRIVHRGKNRFNIKERVFAHYLQWMCRRVIQEEIALLKMDI